MINLRRLRFAVALVLALSGCLGIGVGSVWAHAQYSSSTPAANATVPTAPSMVQITFTEELAAIRISITGPGGSEVTTAPATFDLEQRHNARVPMRDAGPGLYTVLWHNVSGDDGDPNDGQFVFTVAGPPAPTTATAPAPSAAPAATTPQPGTTSNATTPAATTAQPGTAANATTPAASASQPGATANASTAAAVSCVDNGVRDPRIHDTRVDTYCKRQAIRDKYAGQIDVASFNVALADGEGLESALADAMADFQAEQAAKKH